MSTEAKRSWTGATACGNLRAVRVTGLNHVSIELPDGSVQLYLRDPGGNLVELDWPDVTTLDPDLFGEIPKLADAVPQTDEGLRATLYHLGDRG